MELSINKEEFVLFKNSINNYQETLLKKIHEKYLNDNVSLEKFTESFKGTNKKKTKIVIKNYVEDEYRCHAKIWENNKGQRCNKKKIEELDYCKIHIYKRNYGRFEDSV